MTPSDASADSASAFVRRFLGAFEALDLPAFVDCFAEDASAFFPHPEPVERLDGRAAIAAQFERVFERIRAGATSGPPFHRLEPQDLAVAPLSPEVATVTFHLRNAERVARRTLVLRRVGDAWRIVHLHASNAATAPG
jgi:ketosteroid isomerase-like protein